jgi:hypothetical protein
MLEEELFKINLPFNPQKTSVILQGNLHTEENEMLIRNVFNKLDVPINDGSFEVLNKSISRRWIDVEYGDTLCTDSEGKGKLH